MILGFPLAGELGGELGIDATDPLNNISRLLAAICGAGIQPIETVLQQLLTQRTLDTAVGVQLDLIGKLVGEPRAGLEDATYRRFCRAAIAANTSKGAVENLIRILELVVFEDNGHYTVTPQQVATVQILVDSIPLTADVASTAFTFLRRAAAAGVRVMLDYGTSDPTTWFRFDSGPGYDQGHFIGRIDH